MRALIDPAAETSIISENVATLLSLDRRKKKVCVTGVGGEIMLVSNDTVALILGTRKNPNFQLPFSALVLKKLINNTPKREVLTQDWPHLLGLDLADPAYWKSRRVDCILGADLYDRIICEGIRKGPLGSPVAQQTYLGWILTGGVGVKTRIEEQSPISINHVAIEPQLPELISKFWEIEEVPSVNRLSEEDEKCEKYFRDTYSRQSNGRYVVKLPFAKIAKFSDSRSIAVSCLLRSEKRRQ